MNDRTQRDGFPRRRDAVPNRSDPFTTMDQSTAENPFQFGPYQIVHPIASGVAGCVYRAIHTKSNETVALKLMRRQDGQPASERDKMFFLREMSTLSRLHHPRIISIKDFGSCDEQLFLAMEYIKTFDLPSELQPCTVSQQIRLVCGIGCYMLEGLAHAHSLGFVHRDIKPANLLVYRNQQQSNKIGVKLADFGLSKNFENAGLSGMTREGEIRGTPAFMSPEHLQNSRDAGPASDVYATAAVLYYYLTSMVPHQKDRSTPVTFAEIAEGETYPLLKRRNDLPVQLGKVIDRALLPIDKGRYETAVELNQALIPFTRKSAS